MKRISIVGLCLMAVTAVSAVSVASSSAALPEFEAVGGLPVTFTSTNASNLLPTLHSSVLESNVNCTTTKDTGEIAAGGKTVAKIKVLYTGCKENTGSNTCTSTGEPTGGIVTTELLGRIGYIPPTLTTTKLVGTELEPVPPNKVFAEFTCTGAANKVIVEGCTIGEAKPLKVSQNSGSLLFWENAALNGQLYTLIDGGVHHPCEQTVTASVLKLKGKGWLMDDELESFGSVNVILNN